MHHPAFLAAEKPIMCKAEVEPQWRVRPDRVGRRRSGPRSVCAAAQGLREVCSAAGSRIVIMRVRHCVVHIDDSVSDGHASSDVLVGMKPAELMKSDGLPAWKEEV